MNMGMYPSPFASAPTNGFTGFSPMNSLGMATPDGGGGYFPDFIKHLVGGGAAQHPMTVEHPLQFGGPGGFDIRKILMGIMGDKGGAFGSPYGMFGRMFGGADRGLFS